MKLDYLIFYIYRLIKDGHEWQYKNLNGIGKKPTLYFSFLQIIAIFIGIAFIVYKPEGFYRDATDSILGCLSIMVALFLSLILVVFDKSKNIKSVENVEELHSMNFFYQFFTLVSYAVLLSVLVIVLILINIVFNLEINLLNYNFIDLSLWNKETITTFFKCSLIICIRFSIVYFLVDFFIICLYAICSIYQFVRLGFMKSKPKIKVNNEEPVDSTFEREFGFSLKNIKYGIYLIFSIMLICVIWRIVKILMNI